MKNLFSALSVAMLMLAGNTCVAQGLAVNSDSSRADHSAILDVKSTTRGALLPRMTKTQRSAITGPAAGLLVYQTDSTPGYYYYSGTAWQLVGDNAGPWTLSGSNIYNNNTGNVGVGTTAPTAQLEVKTMNTNGILVRDNTNLSTGVYARDSGSDAIGVYGWVYGANSIGVAGYSYNSTGVAGNTKYGTGVSGSSSQGTGGFFTGNYALITDLGNVGIGTPTPTAQLEVSTSNTHGILLRDNADNSLGIYARDSGDNATGVYGWVYGANGVGVKGYAQNGVGIVGATKYGTGVQGTSSDGTGGYFTSLSSYALITDQGNVGIGIPFPSEQLDVNGAIRLGTTTSTNPGTIRYDGTNFQGYTAGAWMNFGGGGTSQWNTSGTNIYNNNSGNVGIGTTSPLAKFDVHGSGLSAISVTDNTNFSNALFVVDSGGSANAILGVAPGTNGAGIAGRANIGYGVLGTATQGYGVYGSGHTGIGGYFTSDSNYALITGHGNVGINTASPTEQLDVNGGIRLGNTTNTNTGTIRYNGTDFQGYTGSGWTNLGAGTGATQWTTTGSNIYYNTGNVGINNSAPVAQMDVISNSGSVEAGKFTITNTVNPAAAVYGQNEGSGPGVRGTSDGVFGTGVYGSSSANGTGGYFSSVSGNAIVTGNGNSGFGTPSPQQRVDVAGAIRIANTTSNIAGSIRFNGTNFQGYDGTVWNNFGAGTTSQWTTSGRNIYYNNSRGGVSIGNTDTSSAMLNVAGSRFVALNVVDSAASGVAINVTSLHGGYGVYSDVDSGSAIYGRSSASTGVYGYSSSVGTAVHGNSFGGVGGLFESAIGPGLVVSSGKTGLGTTTPTEQLDVNGGVRIGNTLSTNAGTIRFNGTSFQAYDGIAWNNFGGIAQWIGSGTNIYNNNAGNTGIGTTAPAAKLEVDGTLKFVTGTPGTGKVLTSDATGNATWQSPAAFNDTLTNNLYTNGYLVTADGSNGLKMQGNGIVLCKGVTGSSGTVLTESYATSGFSAKMIWYPKKTAFRVGSVNNTQWDDANIGSGSVAMGSSTVANGTGAFSAGSGDTASGQYSVAMGTGSTASGQEAIALGNSSKATGDYAVAFSYGQASGIGSFAHGNSVANGLYSIAMGSGDTAGGAAGANYATVIGNGSTASGDRSIALGTYVSTNGHPGSCIIGDDTHFSYTVLNNDADQQMMMRFGGGYKLYSDEFATLGLQITPGGVAKYLTNVAGSYDARSLVDKHYVDSVTSGGSSPWTVSGTNIYNNTAKVSIGTNTTTTARVLISDNTLGAFNDVLDVKTYNNYSYAIKGEDMTTSSSYGGVYGTTNVGNGVKGQSNGNGAGVYGSSANGVGVYGTANVSTGAITAGGYFEGTGTGSYALLTGIGNVGIGTNFPSVKLEICGNEKVNGNIQASGTITASAGISCPSDVRYKKDIKTIDSALLKVMNMRGVTYNWKQSEFPDKDFSDKLQVGVIAQELEKVYPELVFTDEHGYKSVDYTRLAPILIEAMKQQQLQIEALQKENTAQKAQVEKMADISKRLDLLEASVRGTTGEVSSK